MQSPKLLRPKRPTTAAATPDPTTHRDLVLWLDAQMNTYTDDTLTTPVTGDSEYVGAWVDRTANAWVLAGTGDTRPFLILNYYSTGVQVIEFGTNMLTGIDITFLQCLTFTATATWSFAVVLVPLSHLADQPIVQSGDSDKQMKILSPGHFDVITDQSYIPGHDPHLTTVTPLLDQVAYIVTGRVTGSSLLRLNNINEDTDSGGGAVNWDGLTLGDAVIPAETGIGELLIWGAELTNAELTAAYQYLANKYNL